MPLVNQDRTRYTAPDRRPKPGGDVAGMAFVICTHDGRRKCNLDEAAAAEIRAPISRSEESVTRRYKGKHNAGPFVAGVRDVNCLAALRKRGINN